MSLFSSIQLANNSLQAQQIGLQVVGQNIANVNTPGYIREEVVFQPAPSQKKGDLVLGTGVEVTAIIQKFDAFLEERVRAATSERANTQSQQETYMQLEGLIGELSDTDLSTSLNAFFSSISEVLNQPESTAVRNLAILQGQSLANDIRRLADRVVTLRSDIDKRVTTSADTINRLTEKIVRLNRRITVAEGGSVSESDAVGLRDQRNVALSDLAELVEIRVSEQASGSVNVFAGGDFLILEDTRREVEVVTEIDRGQAITRLQMAKTNSSLPTTNGAVGGLITSRDEILGGFLDELDQFASTLAFEFNRVHSSGQGLTGYQSILGEFPVVETDEPLDATGLAFTPVNGSFQVLVRNQETGVTKTTEIRVDLNGLNDDASLEDIVASLDAVEGLSAVITADKRLSIQTDSASLEMSFAQDTSGTLAALGINTFFTGSTAGDIGIRGELLDDPSKFAASRSGVGEDSDNAVLLAGFLDISLDSTGGDSIGALYARMTGNTTQAASVARAVAEGDQVFEQSLAAQRMATSGVSLDDEIVKMISFQQAYQVAARYISELRDLMQILINI